MKVALVIWSLDAGGAERVMARLANLWAQDRRVTLITLHGEATDHYDTNASVDRIRLRMVHASSFFGSTRANVELIRQIREALRSIKPDVVVSFMDRTNVQVLAATRGLGVPVVVSERTDPRFHQISNKARVMRRLLYPRADAVVVQTKSVRSWCESFVNSRRVWVVPNPVVPCEVGHLERTRSILGVGRLSREKGFDLLIESFARVADEFPDWGLTILGEGPDRSALESLAHGLGVDQRLAMPGIVDDPETFMSRAGVFVLASRYEGFPNALLEAMSCGTAVIAADCHSGPSEIVDHGHDGLLIPPEDIPALTTALRQLMADETNRERLGSNAGTSAERYSVLSVLSQWETVFGSLHPRLRGGHAMR